MEIKDFIGLFILFLPIYYYIFQNEFKQKKRKINKLRRLWIKKFHSDNLVDFYSDERHELGDIVEVNNLAHYIIEYRGTENLFSTPMYHYLAYVKGGVK